MQNTALKPGGGVGFRSSRIPLVREAVDTARSLTIITRRISSNAIAIDVKFQSRPVWAGFNHLHGKVPRQPLLRLRVGAFISHILPFLLSLDSRHIPALSLGLNHRAPVPRRNGRAWDVHNPAGKAAAF